MDREMFRDPPKAYRGVTLWMLNDKLEVDEIRRQLDGLHRAGWGAMIGRTFNGLRTKYLSEEWMDIIDTIIQGAGEHGMKVWLQAGYMPSAMPDIDPAFAHQGVTIRDASESADPNDRPIAEHGGHAFCVRRMESVLDLLNPEAVRWYLDKAYIETWHARFGAEFGKTVEAVWVDEPHFRPPLIPWSDLLPGAFEKAWGYKIEDHIPSLFLPEGDFERIRHQYWRTVLQLFLDGYFAPVGTWCGDYGVKFAGHLMGEDTLANQIGWTGATMPCYEAMQLPGIDHLTMSVYWPARKKFILTPKQCSSAANQLGTEEVLAEMFGVSSQGITFEDRKHIANWMAVLGINYRCYHGSFYSLRGRRKRIYVPHLSHQQPWWPDNRIEADYFARVSYAMRRGQTAADVLVLHPVESAFCRYDPTSMYRPHDRTTERADVREFDDRLVQLCDNLLGIQRDFEFGDETLLARHGRVDGKTFRVGRAQYAAVMLPDMLTIRQTTLDLLREFASAGGTVLAAGTLPDRIDGAIEAAADELAGIAAPVNNDPEALERALNTVIPADVTVRGVNSESDRHLVWTHARKLDRERVYFIANTSRDTQICVDVRFRGTGRLESWDLDTGSVDEAPQQRTEADGVATRLDLAPADSRLFVFKEGEEPVTVAGAGHSVVRTVELPSRGEIRRDQPNALTLDFCRYRTGDGEWSERLPVLRVQELLEQADYHGPVSLEFQFNAEHVPDDLRLVIEDAAEYRISINGKPVEYAGDEPYIDASFQPVAIATAAVPGNNRIELTRTFAPIPKAKFALAKLFEVQEGVELESIYLTGSFELRGAVSSLEPRPRCVRYRPDFVLAAARETSDGDFTSGGYPFYAGRIFWKQAVSLTPPAEGERIHLALPSLDAALVKIHVNSREAGAIAWAPYRLDITEFVRDGENELEIEFIGTLRNLLGAHHRSAGEPDNMWHTAFAPGGDPKMREHPEEGGGWTDDYFVLNFGVRKPCRIEYLA